MRAESPPCLSCWRAVAGLVMAMALSTASRAQVPIEEEVVEAAYLHKFPGFVDWPADSFKTPASPIVIGVMGAPRVLDELTKVARGRLVLGRPVEARAISVGHSMRGLHVLFIGKGAGAGLQGLLEEAQKSHVLTVTDVPEGLKLGTILDFVQVDGRLRFEASLPAAQRAEVKLSSKLLSVASRVVEETP